MLFTLKSSMERVGIELKLQGEKDNLWNKVIEEVGESWIQTKDEEFIAK